MSLCLYAKKNSPYYRLSSRAVSLIRVADRFVFSEHLYGDFYFCFYFLPGKIEFSTSDRSV